MVSVVLRGLTLRFDRGSTAAVDGVDLEVPSGQLLTIVGPSGSGKTTLLRLIAGLEAPSAGRVELDGADVTDVPTRDRDLAMVFQDAGLQPHLDVRRNLEFPLRLRRRPRREIDDRVGAAARVLDIEQLLALHVNRLAAGQRQAVSTARELTRYPRAFLLDEPLVHLDPHRRDAFRREIALLQRGFGATMLYATNDPHDALALGHRIAVLVAGRLRQVGPPGEVHDAPADTDVAGLVGDPVSLLRGRLERGGGAGAAGAPGAVREAPRLVVGDASVRAPRWAARWAGRDVTVGVRPAALTLEPALGALRVPVVVDHTASTGDTLLLAGTAAGGAVVRARVRRAALLRPGERIDLHVDPGDLLLFDAHTGGALRP